MAVQPSVLYSKRPRQQPTKPHTELVVNSMCFFLSRHFQCVRDDEWIQHTHQYLVRCANPEYAKCIVDGALVHLDEGYSSPCHTCTGKFMQPRDAPVVWSRSPPDETTAAAQAAAVSYVNSLCDLVQLSSLPRWDNIYVDDGHEIKRTARMELACRFRKDHFHRGPRCGCCETNTQPELHNPSAAHRQSMARVYLFPWEQDGEADQQFAMEDAEEDVRQLTAAWDILTSQPELDTLNRLRMASTVGEIRVIPFYLELWDSRDRTQHVRDMWQRKQAEEGGAEGWKNEYNMAFVAHEDVDVDDESMDWEIRYRKRLVKLMIDIAAGDPGLPLERLRSVVQLCFRLLDVDLDRLALDETLGPAFGANLWDLHQRARSLSQDGLQDDRPAGSLWLNELKWEVLDYSFRRNRMLRYEDERVREAAIESTVTPLTAAQVAALPADRKECSFCFEELRNPSEHHAAMRMHCPSGHLIGRNCWMEAWRAKRLHEMDVEDGILCHSCAHFKIGDWRVPSSRWEVWLDDMKDIPDHLVQYFLEMHGGTTLPREGYQGLLPME
ncbi:hypothetical protein C8035_v007909 [Colletotrichum spinosum]|uniref:Uncharacterized protein n=1 Tax=Colletotrichum spinosum TaxID=1347390 RepID=A0A4R8QEG4_9PEZI|nr:hypothetical protein C8035_v007909 [Colletotrichum spinosum]